MPIVKNSKGYEIIEVSNLNELGSSNDTLHLANEEAMLSKLDAVVTNTSNISIDANSVSLNVDGLETLQTAANSSLVDNNTKLDTIDNTIQNQASLIDQINSKLGILDTSQVVVVDSALPNGATTLIKQTEIETAVVAVEASQQLILTKLTEVDEVLDTIKLDTRKNITEIQFISNFSLGSNSQLTSTTKNVTAGRHCCVVGTETGNSGAMVQLFGGLTNSTSDMYLVGEGYYKETAISGQRLLEFGHISNICFNFCYVKFINTSSTATQVTAKILIRD